MYIRFKKRRIAMIIVFALVFAYTYLDVTTGSTSYNFTGQGRGMSHIMLALTIMGIVLSAMFFKTDLARGYGPYTLILLGMAVWTTMNCLMFQISLWTTVTYVGFTVWWMFAFLLMKRYCAKDMSDERFVIALCLLMLGYYVYEFINTFNYARVVAEKENAVLNIIFRILVFVPLILLMRKGWLKKALIVLVAVLVCASLKRAALLAYPLMLLVYIFVNAKVKGKSFAGIFRLLLAFALIYVAFVIADHYFDGFISERFSREQLESGSGRVDRWTESLAEIGQRGIGSILVGSGIGSAGYSQHNEWVEQLYSFGLVGFILYVLFAIRLIGVFLFYYKANSDLAGPYAAFVVFFLVVGMFSGFMYMHSTLYLFIFAGICESRYPYRGRKRLERCED